jgi:hypothetical protein
VGIDLEWFARFAPVERAVREWDFDPTLVEGLLQSAAILTTDGPLFDGYGLQSRFDDDCVIPE